MPYKSTEVYPFYASNYPPFYHVVLAPFVWFFGEAYWYGRLFSFVSTLVTAYAIGRVVLRHTQARHVAFLSGLAFLASNTVYHIGALFRQHISMVMFETLAIVILAYAFPNKKPKGIALGFLMLILAGYTKQLAIFTAIAVLLWAFLQNPRRAILWGIGFGLAGLGIFAYLTVATGGEWWRQAILANVGGINAIQVFALFKLTFQLHGFLLLPALAYVVYELYIERLSLYSVWLVVTLILGGISSGTWGGGDSYFSTAIGATCLVSGLALGRLWQHRNHALPYIRVAVLLLIPLLYIGYGRATLKMPTDGAFAPLASALNIQPNAMGRFYDSASRDVGGYAYIGHFTTPEDIAMGQYIVSLIQAEEKPVLSEEAGFSLVAGRDVITNPTQLLNLEKAGLFNGETLIKMIQEQAFGLIIFRAQFYPSSVLEAIWQFYEQRETVPMNGFEYLILYPKS